MKGDLKKKELNEEQRNEEVNAKPLTETEEKKPEAEKPDLAAYLEEMKKLAKDLNGTNSLTSWDSDQYKKMRAFLEPLMNRETPFTPKEAGIFFEKIKILNKDYQDHANRHPKPNNARRNARLGIMAKMREIADDYQKSVKDPRKKDADAATEAMNNCIDSVVNVQPDAKKRMKETYLPEVLNDYSTFTLNKISTSKDFRDKLFAKLIEKDEKLVLKEKDSKRVDDKKNTMTMNR